MILLASILYKPLPDVVVQVILILCFGVLDLYLIRWVVENENKMSAESPGYVVISDQDKP